MTQVNAFLEQMTGKTKRILYFFVLTSALQIRSSPPNTPGRPRRFLGHRRDLFILLYTPHATNVIIIYT